jgi:glycine betaine/proline transport system substrate-binding protein
MIRKLPIRRLLFLALASSALALTGCSSGTDGADSQPVASSSAPAPASSAPASAAAELGDDHIKLVYVEWASCTAATNVVKTVLEHKGYTVDAVSVSGAALYSALANQAADATVCAWLPTTHANYYARTKDQLENLGPNMTGTKLGLVVPDYVTIDSIPELAEQADQFKGRIVGIDPGAGEMGLTQDVIKQYQLPLELVAGSGATMTAALKSAIDNQQWIVVTGWTPHWMWARWNLKYLSDPKGVYGQAEEIDTLVGKGLKTDSPQAYAVLDAFHWSADQMQQVMADGRQPGQDPESSAHQWVAEHADTVSAWTSAAH